MAPTAAPAAPAIAALGMAEVRAPPMDVAVRHALTGRLCARTPSLFVPNDWSSMALAELQQLVWHQQA
eukprot:4833655-Alexandrium_andersonii.AAC.1